jgi:hypothetical protein
MAIANRKEVALEQKIDALDAEFSHWLKVTEKDKEFEKHHTQVRALTGHLSGLWGETQAIFKQAKQDGTVLEDAQNVESLVLGLRRIWEFFRSKLTQRRDPKMLLFLQAADELAWACYKPMLDLHTSSQRREPPLVFLNGGLSPFALSRDQAFLAEDVPGQALTGKTYDPILQHLPIPVIGVPWNQVAHLPDLPVVAHETGHAVEQDFGLHGPVLDNLKLKLGAGSPHLAHWEAWSKEVFADLWGCLKLGPAYANSLMDFLASGQKVIENEVASASEKYPTAHLRVLLCVEALKLMKFKDESAALESEWKRQYQNCKTNGFGNDVQPVVCAILGTTLEGSGLAKPLLEIEGLRFSADDWKYAIEGVNELKKGHEPDTANTIVRWTAAARYLYDQCSLTYARDKYGKSLLKYAKTLIDPGTRSGETVLNKQEKEQVHEKSKQSGKEWFNDFAEWSRGSRQASDEGRT